MISLLLTLFISLFSYCPSVNHLIEDHTENNTKQSIVYNDYQYLFSMYEVINTDNFVNYYEHYTDWFDTLFNGGDVAVDHVEYYTQVYSASLYNGYSNIDYSNLSIPSSDTYYDFNEIRFYYISRSVLDADNGAVQLAFKLRFFDTGTQQFKNLGSIDGIMFYVLRVSSMEGRFMTYRNDYGDINNWCIVVNSRSATYFVELFTRNSDDYDEGYTFGYDEGNRVGFQEGYVYGINEASQYDSVASSIFEGIFDVGLLPVNVFLTIFNFDVFGINIAGIISGLLTLSVVIIIVRMLLGGKKDD